MSNNQEFSGGNDRILSIDEAFEEKALESMVWSREQIRIEH